MSTIEKITEKILSEAREQAEAILKEAKDETSRRLLLHRKEMQAEQEREFSRADRSASAMAERLVSGAALESRDLQLKARQELLDRAFEAAGETLKNLSEEEYAAFLKKTLGRLDCGPEAVLFVPPARLEQVKSLGLAMQVEARETLESGFIVDTGPSRYNYDFSELLDFRRSEMEKEVLSVLLEGKQ